MSCGYGQIKAVSSVQEALGGFADRSPSQTTVATRCRRLIVAAMLALWAGLGNCTGEETAPPSPAVDQIHETNAVQIVAAFRELQESVRATQQAIEQNRRETRQAAAQSATGLSNALQTVQASFAAQRMRDLEAIQQSNRVILTIAGAFAAVGLLALLLIGYLQWRLCRELAEMTRTLPPGFAPDAPATAAALNPGEVPSPARFAAIEPPGKQIAALEHAPRHASKPRRRFGRSIERRLFPGAGDSLRRRQFRALRAAILFGLVCAGMVAVVLYLVYVQPKP